MMRFGSSVVATGGAALLIGWLLATPAFAQCNADNAIFADDFEFLDGTWGDATDNFYVDDGALIIKQGYSDVNFSTKNDAGADVCVDTTIVDDPAPDNSAIGIAFWWQDWDNYYAFYYWNDGSYSVNRTVKGKETALFGGTTLALKKGVGQTNQIELKLRPKDATLIINGTEVKRFKGIQPADGGAIGVTAGSPQEKPGTFKYDNFIVSPPS